MDNYRRHVNRRFYQNLRTTHQLQRWTCERPQDFWLDLYSYLRIVPSLPPTVTKAYDDTVPMSSNPPFFPGLELNYAENAMFANSDPDAVALIGIREGQDLSTEDGEVLTWQHFRDKVRLTASALRRCGVKKGDRVAALVATSNWVMVLVRIPKGVSRGTYLRHQLTLTPIAFSTMLQHPLAPSSHQSHPI